MDTREEHGAEVPSTSGLSSAHSGAWVDRDWRAFSPDADVRGGLTGAGAAMLADGVGIAPDGAAGAAAAFFGRGLDQSSLRNADFSKACAFVGLFVWIRVFQRAGGAVGKER